LKYGLQVSTKDLSSGEVTSVLCLFCSHCGERVETTFIALQGMNTLVCEKN
jgi:hypothetical protein